MVGVGLKTGNHLPDPPVDSLRYKACRAPFESISGMRSEFASPDLVCVEYALVREVVDRD